MLQANGTTIDPKSRNAESTEGGLHNIKEAKDFDSIRHNTQDNETHKMQKWVKNCKYCRTGHPKR